MIPFLARICVGESIPANFAQVEQAAMRHR
jgi:hypothetical protein